MEFKVKSSKLKVKVLYFKIPYIYNFALCILYFELQKLVFLMSRGVS
jgi:hypothetical protein